MAGCSSSIRIAYFKNLQNEVVLSRYCRSRHLVVNKFQSSCVIGARTTDGKILYEKKRQRLVIVNEMNPEADPQSGVAVTTVTEASDVDFVQKDVKVMERNYVSVPGDGGVCNDGSGGNGKFSGGGGGGGGGGGDDSGEDYEEKEFGPLLKFEEVIRETEARGATLPADMLEAAKTIGLRKVFLLRYLDLQGSVWPLGFLMRSSAMLRNRMLADPTFLFKIGTEIVIDSCCATFAEVKKRGKDFWAEFELYTADLLVGVVVNVALVGMLAPYARIGQPSASQGLFGRMLRAYGALPSSVFEAERPGSRFSVNQRIATYFYKGILYGFVGFGCGIIGQGIANLIMTAKRSIKKSEDDIPVPPLVKSAALWGVFLAVSSNTRYQIINGLEHIVEASPLAKQLPPVALAFTVGVRFANNVYGGMQFVDWARFTSLRDDDNNQHLTNHSNPQEDTQESSSASPTTPTAYAPPRSSRTMVIGTIFGHRKGGHVWFCIQQNRLTTRPSLLLELSIPISTLIQEMQCGLVRIALEFKAGDSADSDLSNCPLHSVPLWTLFCNGRKLGFAVRRKATQQNRIMLKTMQNITVGAGVIPCESGSGSEEIMYMRANYEFVVGSADSESFHLINPDEGPGQEFSVFLLRSR
ncbi:hypothetical protein BUALT_Bualt09G0118000 [Buddleja alternifolia]|uniref:Uncharacterized protein n=1 Tax=Buddleja alternifolia TaxID=168488 RepID=A0AAV6X2C1_9LAMI|nr:hypothetical protein BUALT_Bualt09G0118000 [Buddleja alternifolia]